MYVIARQQSKAAPCDQAIRRWACSSRTAISRQRYYAVIINLEHRFQYHKEVTSL